MVRRLGLGKNNHLSYASLALNPRFDSTVLVGLMVLVLFVFCGRFGVFFGFPEPRQRCGHQFGVGACGNLLLSCECVVATCASRKHASIILTPLNPTSIL